MADAGGPALASPGTLLLPDRRVEPHSQRKALRRGTCLGTPGPVPKGADIQFGAWPQSQVSLIMTLPRSPWALMLDVSLGEDRGRVPLSSLGNFMAVSYLSVLFSRGVGAGGQKSRARLEPQVAQRVIGNLVVRVSTDLWSLLDELSLGFLIQNMALSPEQDHSTVLIVLAEVSVLSARPPTQRSHLHSGLDVWGWHS